jgi:cellulose synthase operon protein C
VRLRASVARGVLFVALAFSPQAHALTWPDAADRAERDLSSPDPAVRRAATERLRLLGTAVVTPLLERALGDPDVDVRIAAAHVAIAKHVTRATHLVLPWLGEREARLRAAACEVAGAIPDPNGTTQLARALSDADATVRAAAANALGEQASKDATPPLLGKLDDPSPVTRVEVVRALARLGDPRSVIPLIGKAEDSVPEVRQAVARALGALGDPRAAPALVLQLRDPVTDVKVASLTALGLLHAESATDAISPLATDRNPLLRRAAVEALGRIASADAIRTLVALLGMGDDGGAGLETSGVREALVNAGSKAKTPLVAVLGGASTPLAATSAAWVLTELRATAAVPDLVRAMRRGTLPVTAALHALGRLGSEGALEVVLEFVDDKSAAERKEALVAAESLLDPAHPDGRAVEPLSAALLDPALRAAERARIAFLLGRTGAARATPILVSLVSAKDQEVRLSAIDALGALGGSSRADGPLLSAMDDPDPSVRLHAAVALGQVGGAAARDALLAHVDKGTDVDRPATLAALGGILARAPSDAALHSLAHALELTEGPVRDALILALARADLPAALPTLTSLARSPNPEDRRTLASALAARRATPATLDLLGTLLADAEPSVRADAAWSLGEVSGAASLPNLEGLLRSPDLAPATNAAAAVARIRARAQASPAGRAPDGKVSDPPPTELCALLSDSRSQVRANAAAGLALLHARCGDGAAERRMLEKDPMAFARASAARAIAARPLGPADAEALDRCKTAEPSGTVARQCHPSSGGGPVPSPTTEPVEIYVEDALGTEPRPGGPFVVLLPDGLLRAGKADRRGAFFDAAAPRGEVSLLSVTTGAP